jgi:hypothetical protein
MANKKSLKHVINLVCEELFAEAVAASLYGNDVRAGNAEAVLSSIVLMHSNYISRISHIEPGIKPKTYFKDLREKFHADVNEIVDQINNL